MSDDALARYVDARAEHGDAAPEPPDEETKALVGTLKLAESALGSPSPSEEAEKLSRERLVSQLEEATLLGRPLRDETPHHGVLDRLKRWLKGSR